MNAAQTAPAAVLNLRPVHAGDAPAMQAFVQGLDPAARRQRFHGAVNACAPGLLRHLTQADGQRHVAFVACSAGGAGGDAAQTIVGEARYFVTGGGRAEFAITVADGQRGSGLADALLTTLLQAAQAGGLQALYGDVLNGNERMAGFMRRHGFAPDASADAEPGVTRWQHAVGRQAPRAQPARPAPASQRWARLRAWLGGRSAPAAVL